jgi:hypothetical protein
MRRHRLSRDSSFLAFNSFTTHSCKILKQTKDDAIVNQLRGTV